MKRKLNRKVLITTLAASVLLGGGAFSLLQSDVLAETATTQTQSSDNTVPDKAMKDTMRRDGGGDKHGFKGGLGGIGGKGLIQETATILGVDEKTLSEQVRAGQTLLQIAQAAGLTEAAYLEKLVAAETTKINEQLSAGKITQAQADQIKAELTERLKQSISSAQPVGGDRGPGGPKGHGGPGGHGKGGGGIGFLGSTDTLTSALGMTKEELKAAQDAGKSLSEIAAEKGITEESLISKLKDGLTEQLKKFVQNKREPRAEKPQTSTAPSASPAASSAASATNT